MFGFSLDKLPDLSNASIPLSTILVVLGVVLGGKWVVWKVAGTIWGGIKGAVQTVVSSLPTDSIKVSAGYVTAAALLLGGMSSTGYGISNTVSSPTPANPDDMYKEALSKIKAGADKEAVQKLMQEWQAAKQKNFEAQRADYEKQVAAKPETPSVPFITGGVVMAILGAMLIVRTSQVDR